ncbi:MAG: hypothetical protein M3198_15415 [Actinomycetota bacterium]|nr:hypothetical protein [Actinomycetota bacterium]
MAAELAWRVVDRALDLAASDMDAATAAAVLRRELSPTQDALEIARGICFALAHADASTGAAAHAAETIKIALERRDVTPP